MLAAAGYSLWYVSMNYAFVIHHGDNAHIYNFKVPLASPERHRAISFISFLPFSVLHWQPLYWTCVAAFYAAATLWFFRLWCRWTAPIAAFLYTFCLSLFWEHGGAVAEWWNPVATSLIIMAGWQCIYATEIRDALRAGEFWQRPLFPVWVHELNVFSLAWFFFQTGWGKLTTSGLAWVDGTSLQLHVHRFRLDFGEPQNFMHHLILSHRLTASLFSAGVLLLECSAILAVLPLFFPRFRWVRHLIGLGITLFMLGIFLLFGLWAFESLFALALLFLWPFDRWIPRWMQAGS